jgi:predicted Zn-dependent peptidase
MRKLPGFSAVLVLAAFGLPALHAPALAQQAAADAVQPAPLSQLLAEVDIPFEKFTLANGLTVVVHEDRKAPVVAVSVWYDVGSKHEPAGKTGFAHLFEHLMYNGSENAPGDFFEPLQDAGATDFNGTTSTDRTNYFETVPTGALELALMLESDRMGHLLGAVTQEKLDNQRGVVQNEKRQGDNQPYGLLRYEIFENLFPKGHRYHHSTIGSMDDLNSASLEDVQKWFRDHYGPNNAVLVLAGDIDTASARPLVEKWFGDIAAGPEVVHPEITVPTLAEPKEVVTTDQIATTRLYRMWITPDMRSPESVLLSLGASVLGGLSSSRLDNELVRRDPVAVSVVSGLSQLEDAGFFMVYADVRPGQDPVEVGAKLDAEIARLVQGGPTADELQRAKTTMMAGTIQGLEAVGGFGGKAVVLAEGELYTGDPAFFRTQLEQIAAATPEAVTASLQTWLSRPVFKLEMRPGARTGGGENRGGAVIDGAGGDLAAEQALNQLALAYYCGQPQCGLEQLSTLTAVDRSQLPPIAETPELDFPEIERATLSNGIEVYFARRDAVPTVSMALAFDAGYAADPKDALGTQALMVQSMDEGTRTLDSIAFAEAQERLGASISAGFDADWSYAQLTALSPNLAPSVELLADFVRNPAFKPEDVERVRAQQLNRINSELSVPAGIASRVIQPLLYGPDHPYGIPSPLGDPQAVAAVSSDDLAAFHRQWFRPDNARILVVGDTTLAELVPQLERSLGDWQAPQGPRPSKDFGAMIPAPQPRVVLVDRPNSPQSVISAGRVLDLKGTEDLVGLLGANEVFGGNFLSRINMNLRETKGWSYGVRSTVGTVRDRVAFTISAPVQADRTGDSIAELRRDLTDLVSSKGVTPVELQRLVNGNVRELPGQFETSGAVLTGLMNIVKYERPFDYYEQLADKYRAFTAADLDTIARDNFVEDQLVFVVVGDAAVVRPQLESLGLPVEVRSVESIVGSAAAPAPAPSPAPTQ